MEILEQALEAARTFRPMSKAEVQALLARTAKAAAKRRVRAVQDHLDLRRDGAANPDWLGEEPERVQRVMPA